MADIDTGKRITTVSFATHLNKLRATVPTFTKKLSQQLPMGISVWEEYFVKRVHALQIPCTCSHLRTDIRILIYSSICFLYLLFSHTFGQTDTLVCNSTFNTKASGLYDIEIAQSKYTSFFFCVVKGPAADATDAPQP
jgi:hypothetical protein